MSKRFTDTKKYRNPFFRALPGPYKLLWDYLYHDCDHAGIWIVDFEVAQIYLGKDMLVTREEALELFNHGERRVLEIDAGQKWFLYPFIEFQYGTLCENNRVHQSVLSELKKYKIKPLTSPLQGAKDIDKDKDKDKDKEKEKEKDPFAEKKEIIFPFTSENFMHFWHQWREYKLKQHKFKYASPQTEQAALLNLNKISDGNELKATEIILQSIANGWKGFFQLNNEPNGKANKHSLDKFEAELLGRLQPR